MRPFDNILYSALLAAGILCLSLTGCVNARVARMQVEPGSWQIRQGQATWQYRPNRPELSGEVLVATAGEASIVRFSKDPMPIVDTQRTATNWLINFPAQKVQIARKGGKPPGQFLWLHLAPALEGKRLPKGIEFFAKPDNAWLLVNRRSGERIEGFLSE